MHLGGGGATKGGGDACNDGWVDVWRCSIDDD